MALPEATIKALQEALNKQGIAVKADGVLNDETRTAIRTYQSQHHLPVTGEPDKATLNKLGVVVSQGAATAPAESAPPTAGQGQMQAGMMMNCPMMQGQMQEMMKMMQGMMAMMQMMQGKMQRPAAAWSNAARSNAADEPRREMMGLARLLPDWSSW